MGFLGGLISDLAKTGLLGPGAGFAAGGYPTQTGGTTTQAAPQTAPTPQTPGGGTSDGFPSGPTTGGGGGGGGGGGTPGQITPPGSQQEAGPQGGNQGLPEGFERFPFFGGYFYNGNTGEIGRQDPTDSLDINGNPTFNFHRLTKDEKANFLHSVNAAHPELNVDTTLGTGFDPAGMANVAVRQQELAEQIRHQRMQEAQAAADAAAQRFQAMMQARLEGAKYAVTPSMAASGYFPGLSPTSALVRAGVADPLSFQPSYFNPASINAGPNPDQLARDIAAVRGAGAG